MKETILNKPDKPPFPLARFKAGGFTRLPSVLGLRLVKGRAADLRTRSLALRYHVAGEQGVELWSETVNATELTLAACKVSVVHFFDHWMMFVELLDSLWAHFRVESVWSCHSMLWLLWRCGSHSSGPEWAGAAVDAAA